MARLTRLLWPLKNLLPKSLFGRSLLILIAPVVLMQAVVSYIFFERHWDTVTRRLARSVAGEVALLTEAYAIQPPATELQSLQMRAARTLQLETVFLPGEVLPPPVSESGFYSPVSALKEELSRQITNPFWMIERRDADYLDLRVQMNDGVLRIITPRNRVSSQTAHIFILWMFGVSIILLGVAVIFLRNQMRPITLLAQAAEDFGKGREVPDFKPAGAAEVRRAASAFLEMRERIARQIAQRTFMLAGVSHDLRTPLTRMNLQLAMLPKSEEVEALRADIKAMQYMLDEYLAFAGGQAGESESLCDIAQIIDEVVQEASRSGKPFKVSAQQPLYLLLRRGSFKRCIVNLVENAIAHGACAEISAFRADDHAEIIIDDDGPGLAPEKYEEAFTPFQRLDDSRSPDRAGVGLGLAIARDIARGHGGDIILGPSPLGGLRATIRIPV